MAPKNDEDKDNGYRLSITMEPSLRKKLRIVAALHDKSIGEYAVIVLEAAADKAVEGLKGKVPGL